MPPRAVLLCAVAVAAVLSASRAQAPGSCPPAPATGACTGKAVGDSCTWNKPEGPVTACCSAPPPDCEDAHCPPTDGMGCNGSGAPGDGGGGGAAQCPPPEAAEACSGKEDADPCTVATQSGNETGACGVADGCTDLACVLPTPDSCPNGPAVARCNGVGEWEPCQALDGSEGHCAPALHDRTCPLTCRSDDESCDTDPVAACATAPNGAACSYDDSDTGETAVGVCSAVRVCGRACVYDTDTASSGSCAPPNATLPCASALYGSDCGYVMSGFTVYGSCVAVSAGCNGECARRGSRCPRRIDAHTHHFVVAPRSDVHERDDGGAGGRRRLLLPQRLAGARGAAAARVGRAAAGGGRQPIRCGSLMRHTHTHAHALAHTG